MTFFSYVCFFFAEMDGGNENNEEKGLEFIEYIGKSSHQGTVSRVTT